MARRVERVAPVDELLRDALSRIVGGSREDNPASAEPESFLEWAQRLPEPKTGALDFGRFPFQQELYRDGVDLRSTTVMKSTQVGASAWLVRWVLYSADVFGLTALYLFPAERQMNDFSRQRIAPLLRCKPLASRLEAKSINNVNQRQIGDGWLYLRGTQAEAGLESIDADVLVFDEYDLIAPESIAIAERRLSSPLSKGLVRRVGWPSVDGYGIAEHFAESDRRRWFVKCDRCSTHQFIRFYRQDVEDGGGEGLPATHSAYVDIQTAILHCGKCRKPLGPDGVSCGEWVAEYPDRDARGYHAHHLLVPGADLSRLIIASKREGSSDRQLFFNRDLGEPYSPEEGRLSLAAIHAAQSRGGGYTQGPRDSGYAGNNVVTMGVDVASTRSLHVRISEHNAQMEKAALFIGEVGSFHELGQLMNTFGVDMCAIDHLPEGRLARGFAEQHAGRVYLVNLTGPGQLDVIKLDPEQVRASVRRTDERAAGRSCTNHCPPLRRVRELGSGLLGDAT